MCTSLFLTRDLLSPLCLVKSVNISEIRILAVGEVPERFIMRELSCHLLLGTIPGHDDHTSNDYKHDINDINNDMSKEPVQITRSVIVPENLRCNQISNSPANEEHSHSEAFL